MEEDRVEGRRGTWIGIYGDRKEEEEGDVGIDGEKKKREEMATGYLACIDVGFDEKRRRWQQKR